MALDTMPFVGPGTGVAVFTRGLFAALGQRSDVELVAYAVTWRGRDKAYGDLPAPVVRTGSAMPARPLHLLWERVDLPPIELFTGRLDVVHGTNFVVPPARRAAEVVTVHDLTVLRFPEMVQAATLRYPALIERAVRRGAFVHTPSQFVADEVIERLRVPAERVRAIHHGLPALPPGDVDEGRRLAGRDRFIFAVGTIEPRKDFPGLVRAFDQIAERHPDVGLVIAGPDGWGIDDFDRALAAARHRQRITRLGWVGDQERAALIAAAAVVAYPSVYEGFGFPPLEAMAAGTPVVTTAAGAVPEVVGDAALVAAVGDDAGVASMLEQVLSDEALAADLVRRGRALLPKYTWTKCAEERVQLYRDAASA